MFSKLTKRILSVCLSLVLTAVMAAGLLTAAPLSVQAASVKQSDLFTKQYAAYLIRTKNKDYKKKQGIIEKDIEECLYTDNGTTRKAIVAQVFKNGFVENIKTIFQGTIGKDYKEKEIEQEVAKQFMQSLPGSDYQLEDVKSHYDKITNAYKKLKKAATVAQAKKLFKKFVESKTDSKKVLKFLEKLDDTTEAGKEASRKKDELEFWIGSLTAYIEIMEVRSINISVTKTVMNNIDKDSALYGGLKQIYDANKKQTGVVLFENIVTTIGLDEMIKALVKEGIKEAVSEGAGGLVKVVNAANQLIGYGIADFLNNGMDAVSIVKGLTAYSNYRQLKFATDKAAEAILNKPGKKNTAKWKFFKQCEFTALSIAESNAKGTKEQEKQLASDYKKYKGMFTVKKYLKSCVSLANKAANKSSSSKKSSKSSNTSKKSGKYYLVKNVKFYYKSGKKWKLSSTEKFSYNKKKDPVSITYKYSKTKYSSASTLKNSMSYTYSGGNKTSMESTWSDSAAGTVSDKVTYDSKGRRTGMTRNEITYKYSYNKYDMLSKITQTYSSEYMSDPESTKFSYKYYKNKTPKTMKTKGYILNSAKYTSKGYVTHYRSFNLAEPYSDCKYKFDTKNKNQVKSVTITSDYGSGKDYTKAVFTYTNKTISKSRYKSMINSIIAGDGSGSGSFWY